MPTVIVRCTCANEFQDGRYGEGHRVHNMAKPKSATDKTVTVRCTVCGSEKPYTKPSGQKNA